MCYVNDQIYGNFLYETAVYCKDSSNNGNTNGKNQNKLLIEINSHISAQKNY